jgi:phospholipid-binding lipoprotein MlaA
MHKIILTLIAIVFFNSYSYAIPLTGYDGKCYEIVDPYEKFNRAMFEVNLTLDHTILRPVSSLYKKSVPSWGRDRVSNFLSNLQLPLTLVNNIAQGDSNSGFKTFWRFFINTTFGLGGLLDFATDLDLPYNPQVFGDTFARYGANYGAYLMLPIIGPATVRDGAGKVYDTVINPVNWMLTRDQFYVLYGANMIDTRAQFLDTTNNLEESSLDYYAQIRSMYIQYKAKKNPRCQAQAIDYNMYNEDVND